MTTIIKVTANVKAGRLIQVITQDPSQVITRDWINVDVLVDGESREFMVVDDQSVHVKEIEDDHIPDAEEIKKSVKWEDRNDEIFLSRRLEVIQKLLEQYIRMEEETRHQMEYYKCRYKELTKKRTTP